MWRYIKALSYKSMLIIEAVINRYLALDPEMLDKLGQFDGKVIKLEMTGINKMFYMLPNKSRNTGPY